MKVLPHTLKKKRENPKEDFAALEVQFGRSGGWSNMGEGKS